MTGASFAAVIRNQQKRYDKAIDEAKSIYNQNKSISSRHLNYTRKGLFQRRHLLSICRPSLAILMMLLILYRARMQTSKMHLLLR